MTSELASTAIHALAHACLIFVGLEFVIAGIRKLRSDGDFERILYSYKLIPEQLTETVAKLLPLVEIALGVCLVLPVTAAVAGAPAAGMLALFAAAMAINLLRGRRHLECGCGSGSVISWKLVIRNLALAGFVLLSALSPDVDLMVLVDALALAAGLQGISLLYSAIAEISPSVRRHKRQGLS